MSDRTEAPTGRRVADARAEGQVARSQEVCVAASLLAGAWMLTGPGKRLAQDLQGLVITSVTELPGEEISTAWIRDLLFSTLSPLVSDLGLILVGLLFTGIVATVAQTGLLFATKRLGFDPNRLNFLNGFKRIFSYQGLFEFAKALAKLLVVGWVAYSFLRSRAEELFGLIQTDFNSAILAWIGLASSLVIRVAAVYFLLAAVDYAYQRRRHWQMLKMTKEEVKEEHKRQEGNPLIKGHIRSQGRRMARMRMMANVPKADVVITNPTHLAVAIQYDGDQMRAPKVLAKGAHLVAERIVKLAREKNIPVIQNIPLARALYRTVEIDDEIPPELYVAMAEVLAYVYKLRSPA
jgi:flagellar biosynthetic protein FlhB